VRDCPITCYPKMEYHFTIYESQLDTSIPEPTTAVTEVPATFNKWVATVTTPDGRVLTDVGRDLT
jgi:hypothetical protein